MCDICRLQTGRLYIVSLNNLTEVLFWLTGVLVWLTGVLVWLTGVLVWLTEALVRLTEILVWLTQARVCKSAVHICRTPHNRITHNLSDLCSGSYSRNPTWSGLRFFRYTKIVLNDSSAFWAWLNLSLFLSLNINEFLKCPRFKPLKNVPDLRTNYN